MNRSKFFNEPMCLF
jgi:serine/threonine protein kinase